MPRDCEIKARNVLRARQEAMVATATSLSPKREKATSRGIVQTKGVGELLQGVMLGAGGVGGST